MTASHHQTTIPHDLPPIGFVRLRQVLAVFPVSRTTWLDGVKSGRFPQPVRLGPATVAWRVEDIRALIESIAGNSNNCGGIIGGISNRRQTEVRAV